MAETKSLPSITKLASDAWELFKKTWVAYLKLVLLLIAYVFLAILLGALIILPISFVAVGSHSQHFGQLTPFNISVFILFVAWFIIFFLSILAADIAFPIAGVFILQGKKTSPIFDLIKSTKPFFWTYLLVALLSCFFVLGGVMLFVIPGLLIAFFFAFVLYEVVIDGHKGLTAFKHSYFMVKNNFWEIFIRLVVLELAYIIISSLLGRFDRSNGLLALAHFIFVLFASWYARAYTFLLYKEVRAKTTFPVQISFNWIWIVSVIGWAIIVLLVVSLSIGLMHLPGAHPQHMHRISPNAV